MAVGPLAGVSKMDIHKRWQTQPNVGRFYSQLGMILLAGGQTSVLEAKRIKDVSSTCCLGDGALRLLGLLKSETGP